MFVDATATFTPVFWVLLAVLGIATASLFWLARLPPRSKNGRPHAGGGAGFTRWNHAASRA